MIEAKTGKSFVHFGYLIGTPELPLLLFEDMHSSLSMV